MFFRVKLQALPGSLCDGLWTVLEQLGWRGSGDRHVAGGAQYRECYGGEVAVAAGAGWVNFVWGGTVRAAFPGAVLVPTANCADDRGDSSGPALGY